MQENILKRKEKCMFADNKVSFMLASVRNKKNKRPCVLIS